MVKQFKYVEPADYFPKKYRAEFDKAEKAKGKAKAKPKTATTKKK